MTTKRFLIHGKVQGVSFRFHCREQAEALAVKGFVRNLPDGSVEVLASGDPESVQRLLSWCRTGPPKSMVQSVDVRDEPAELFSDFEIRF